MLQDPHYYIIPQAAHSEPKTNSDPPFGSIGYSYWSQHWGLPLLTSVSSKMNAARQRGHAAMQHPGAGLAFMNDPMCPSCLTPWLGSFLLGACCAFLLLIRWLDLGSYTILLVIVGMALFRLAAMEAAEHG